MGWLLGLVVGGLLASWVYRRAVNGTVTVAGIAAGVLGALGVAALLPGTVLTTGDLLYSYLGLPGTVTAPATWGGYMFFGVRPLAGIGVLAIVAGTVLAALPRTGPVRLPAPG